MLRTLPIAFTGILSTLLLAACLPQSSGSGQSSPDGAGPAPSPSTSPIAAPEPLGPVYGNAYGAIQKLPPEGWAPETIYENPSGSVRGLVLGLNARYLYFTRLVDETVCLGRIPLAPGVLPVEELIAWAPEVGMQAFGLAADSAGRIYLQGAGRLLRHDPAQPEAGLETLSTSFGPFWNIAVGPTDEVFGSQYPLGGAGSFWISRLAVIPLPDGSEFKVTLPWAQAPPDEPANFVVSGMAMDAGGRAYIMNALGTRLYAFRDLNGDGDALDEGVETAPGVVGNERVLYATLPGYESETMTFGIAALPRGGLLLNRQQYYEGPLVNTGLWILRDVDGDGKADGLAERELYRAEFVYQGLDAGCLATSR